MGFHSSSLGRYVVVAGLCLLCSAVSFDEGTVADDSPTPLPAVRADADGDTVPDRLGDTLSVTGRASIGTGELADPRILYLQDDRHGVAVRLPDRGPGVAEGDSVFVTGVVAQEHGLTQLRALRYTVFDAPRRPPSPRVITIQDARSELHEGVLVHVHGRVVNVGANKGGNYLLLGDGINEEGLLAVFVSKARSSSISLDDFSTGDRVEVTGLVSQHDYSRPYSGYYELLPRRQADLRQIGISSSYYRNALLVISVIFVIAIGVVVLLRAEVKRRTRQLAESQSRFQRLAQATFEGIVIHRDGEILDVNDAIVDMLGTPREAILGRNALEFVSPETRAVVREHIERGDESSYEASIVRADGTSFPAEIVGKNVMEEGRPIRIAAVRDVTQRKEDEARLMQAKEEAEQVARLKSSLINNMSHELRTPITSIIGYSELIIEEPPEMHEAFARRIHRSGKRLSETLRLVLEMAQMEAGTIGLSRSKVPLGEIVQTVVEEHRAFAEERDVTVTVEADDAPTLWTDWTVAYRILSNLFHNAVKFAPSGQVTVTVVEGPDEGRVAVTDTGVGIGEAFMPELFEPFKQESHGRTRDFEGTGLGLTITRRMVDLLGATLSVDSEKGVGSTFTVVFPSLSPEDTRSDAGGDGVAS